jgi:hypothetical protein
LKCSAGTYSSVDASAQCTTCLANTATAVEGIQQCGQPAYSPLYCDAPVPSAAPFRLLSFSPPPRQPPSSNPIPGYGDYTFGQCGPCSTGYCNIGLSNVCSVCPNGSIAPNERSTSCTAYPADYISVPVYGGTFCQPCGHIPYSTYECEAPSTPPTPQPTLAPDPFRTPCNKPGYGLDYNANNVLECRPCREGWRNDDRVESRFCIPCYNSIAPQEGTIDCIKCPAGSVSVPEYSPSGGLYCAPIIPTNAPT